MSLEQQIDMTVALAENGFLVAWNEPVLVKSAEDTVRSTVRAVAESLSEVVAAKRGAPPSDEADQAEAWRGEAPAGPDPVSGVLSSVLGAMGSAEERKTYRIVRRTLICSKPQEVMPVIERAEAAFKTIMELRLAGAILEDVGA